MTDKNTTGDKNDMPNKQDLNFSNIKISFFDLRKQLEALETATDGGKKDTEIKKEKDTLIEKIKAMAEQKEEHEALQFIGWAHIKGEHDIPQDLDKGIALLEQAGNNGSAVAYANLGDLYGGKVDILEPKNYRFSRAFQMYRKAAALGSDYAEFRLATMYYEGSGAPKDTIRAKEYVDMALSHGSFYAMLLAGRMHYDGRGFREDPEKAYEYFRKAQQTLTIESKHDAELFNLLRFWEGRCLFDGTGIKQDRIKGVQLIKTAADEGCKDAEKWLETDQNNDTSAIEKLFEDTLSSFLHFKPHAGSSRDGVIPQHVHVRSDGSSPLAPFSKAQTKRKEPLSQEEVEELLKPLDDLIGLKHVKKEIRNLVYLAQMQCIRESKGLPNAPVSLHAVFMGPPGTGKTTVAKLLGNILHGLGYLQSGHVVETDRGGMVGEYIGETAQKTRRIIESARDGVLFIDEAYALSQYDSSMDFGQEAVATLLKMMEEERDRLVVIAAGYTEEMKKFMASNTGFRSRFSSLIEFDPFDAAELVRVFEKLCEDHAYNLTDNAQKVLRSTLKKQLSGGHLSISNARGVRDLFEKTIRKQAKRIVTENITDDEEIVIIRSDDLYFPQKASQGNVTYLSD